MPELPNNYKIIDGKEWSIFLGRVAGSAQPGRKESYHKDSQILAQLMAGKSIEQAGVDEALLSNLSGLYLEGIRSIYNLVTVTENSRNPMLIKQIWESNMFKNTRYITEIRGVSTAIRDFGPPSPEQLELITDDVIEKLSQGEHVLVHCLGGIGRTGTILSAIYMKTHEQYNAKEAIKYIRRTYLDNAVESSSQEEALRVFGQSLEQQRSTSKNA